jgi:hypothetical protein
MADYQLTHAVTDLEGNLLLAAGTRLTRPDHGNVRHPAGRRPQSQSRCLLDYRQIKSDLLGFFMHARPTM